MFIGFFSYTNEAILSTVEDKDLSILDETVINHLDFDVSGKNSEELSYLEKLVEEQKKKKRFSNTALLKRLSGNLQKSPNTTQDGVLNESFPVHFNMMKHEDSINEMRPIEQ